MGGDGEGGILRTGGQITAAAGLERMDGRREPAPIEVEHGKQNASDPRRGKRCFVRAVIVLRGL